MKKVIPPILFLICILLMLALTLLMPEYRFIKSPINYLGVAPIIIGIAISIRTSRLFDKLNTEIHTFKRPKHLVETDLFRFSRNPIYLGFTIALLGVCCLSANLVALSGVLIFFLISNFWYIPYEEKNMEKEFGDQYKSYKSRIRRWI